MLKQLIVVDDFLSDPAAARAAALSLEYPVRDGGSNYPGRNSVQRIDIPDLESVVSEIIGHRVVGSTYGGHRKCRLALEKDDGTNLGGVHIDSAAHWSCILFLTLPEHCQGGTRFFKHKRLGTDRAPLSQSELRQQGFDNPLAVHSDLLLHDSNDETKWEELMTVPMRFNRLILFRPWLWHTAGISFGDRPENGRLVYLLFFDEVQMRKR